MIPHTIGQCVWLQRPQLFIVVMAMSAAITACHTGPIATATSLMPQDPLDRIAVKVMTTVEYRRCDKVELFAGPKKSVFGCLMHISDTTFYYYQDYYKDWTGPILIAGHEWAARPGTAIAIDRSLQRQLNQLYGTSYDCVQGGINPKGRKYDEYLRYRQWHTSSFTVQLVEERTENDTGPWTGEAFFSLQYVKGPTRCDFLDEFHLGPRALGIG